MSILTATTEEMQEAFVRLQNNPYIPANLVQFIEKVSSLQRDTPPTLPENATEYTNREAFLEGIPYATSSAFIFDVVTTAKLFGMLLALLANDETYKESITKIHSALQGGEFSLQEAYTAFLSGDTNFFATWNQKLGISSNVILFLIQSSITPSLEAYARSICSSLPLEGWAFQYCPCCGEVPFISYWKEAVGAQYNVCSFCHTEYRAPRLQCVYCGEQDHTKLSYLSAEEMPLLNIQTCESCKQYSKIVNYKESTVCAIPELDDVNSIALDVIGQQKGYTRPVVSSWGF